MGAEAADTLAADGVLALAAAIRNRERTAIEVTEIHLAAAHAAQDTLNAFTLIDDDTARRHAADIDRRVAARQSVGPLAGVPLGVKDLIDQAGLPNTNGGNFEPTVPAASATCVARLEAADAVIIGRTGLHEFAFGFSSENHWFGPVRNPWDASLSPGGSSGGSASATAAGLCAAALGTDTGGSVRVPAALCGIVGLKVTHGRVPLSGVTPLAESIDTVGPLGRSVADVAAVYRVIAGDDPSDPWSSPQPVVGPGAPVRLDHLRVGVPHPWTDQAMAPSVRVAFDTALAAIADAGATIVHIDVPGLDFPGELEAAMYPEVANVHRERLEAEPDRYGPEVRRRLERALGYDADDYVIGLRWRAGLQAAAARAMANADVLATPTVAAVRKPIGDDHVDFGGETVPYRPALSRFSALVNHLRFPALALPLRDSGAPPVSVQLIGSPWSEHHLLEVGAALEDAEIAGTTQPPLWRPGS